MAQEGELRGKKFAERVVNMTQARESRSKKAPDKDESSPSTNAHDLPQKPPRQKRKRSPAPVKPEDQHVLTPWLAFMPQSTAITTDQRLHQEIVAYVEYVRPTPQEKTARQTLLEVIQKTLRRRFPDGELKMFGSGATGLCLPTADMDLVVMTREEIPPAEKKRPLFQMSTILKAARLTWDVQVNFRARVPILTFRSLPEYGSISVDIGINNADGPRAIEVVNEYLSTMPALRPLILIVKGFLSQRNLNNAAYGGLGSYAVTCMCISFLQLNPSQRPQDYIDKPIETESLGSLLADFLFYYGASFPYTTSYISVSEGQLLPKKSAEWITNKVPDGLAIQCLINPENDVGKSASRLEAIRSAFKEGYAAILQLSLTDDASLLGPLVSLNQSTVNHRAHIQHIVDSGQLADADSPPPRHPKHRLPPKPTPLRPTAFRPPHQYQHQSQSPAGGSNNGYIPRPPPPMTLPMQGYVPIPYDMAFGGGSVMGRAPYTGGGGGGNGVNRRGSGFGGGMGGGGGGGNRQGAGMHSAAGQYVPEPGPAPWFDSEWPPHEGNANRWKGQGRGKRRKLDISGR
ncbi:hypothetical protein C8F04DRAFT_1343864 [Mycena alexandri]|uniref:polynucleotide adenylyltransferase n=1 Tax=Mycena alexandri TaxID=1745969 RepID=A0AAD6TJW6_9AGAR|nr:hypothetical protein C8F04DRAFT_1343864 [Mycena alexandri]